MQQKTLIIVIVGIVAVAAGAWFYFSGGEAPEQEASSESLNVVARVNGQDISRAELEASEAQIAAGQGIEVSSLDAETRSQLQEQALNNLISQVLIQQKAEEMSIAASEADIDAQIDSIKAQFEDEAGYRAALSQEGLSEAELRSQIADDVVIQTYVAQELDIESVTATEEEIEAEYEQAAAANEGFPELSEVRGRVESSIIQQKQQQLISQHIRALQEAADIKILI
jgi:flagellar basal body-associated protein FliL